MGAFGVIGRMPFGAPSDGSRFVRESLKRGEADGDEIAGGRYGFE